MSDTANDPEGILNFCEECTQSSLATIRREAKKAKILITDEQIRDLSLARRTQENPEFG